MGDLDKRVIDADRTALAVYQARMLLQCVGAVAPGEIGPKRAAAVTLVDHYQQLCQTHDPKKVDKAFRARFGSTFDTYVNMAQEVQENPSQYQAPRA